MNRHGALRAEAMPSSPVDAIGWFGEGIIAICNAVFACHNHAVTFLTGCPVETISTAELKRLQDEGRAECMVLVDVRSPSEQAVSRIPGAISEAEYESDPDRYLGKIVIPYCTVGGRSYLYARKLANRGIVAKNYRESILGWCRSGLPLETSDGKPTNAVHPYWRIFRLPQDYEPHT